jgi:hypothetical protein
MPMIRRCFLTTISLFTLIVAATPSFATDLSGCWTGCWQDCDGHHGPLKASFCRCDDCHYQVVFTGRFWKIFPFRYTVTLNVVGQEGDKVFLEGESYLGRLFGTFTYSAWATETDFVADYSSCKYKGQFILRRTCCK